MCQIMMRTEIFHFKEDNMSTPSYGYDEWLYSMADEYMESLYSDEDDFEELEEEEKNISEPVKKPGAEG